METDYVFDINENGEITFYNVEVEGDLNHK